MCLGFFIDLSETSLKTVLLNNGNINSSIPLGYAASMNETYDNIMQLSRCIDYNHHKCQVCKGLKVVALV